MPQSALALDWPTPYSNAVVMNSVAAAGVRGNDPRVREPWNELKRQALTIAARKEERTGTTDAALTLRALIAGGDEPSGAAVAALVARLVKSQRADGWWGPDLDEASPGDLADTMRVVEALRSARLGGAKVPATVWQKSLKRATAEAETKSGRDVPPEYARSFALVNLMTVLVMSKEATLGAKATAFDFRSLPAVRNGLAWLDRHADKPGEWVAVTVSGLDRRAAPVRYWSYLYAVQRLGELLKVDVVGGRRWYAEGVKYLQTLRLENGSFEDLIQRQHDEPVATTAQCVLFLARATAPITDVDDAK
jgi:hypothetical protein